MRSACGCSDSLDIALTKIRRVYSQIPVTSIHKIRDTFTSASRNFCYIGEDSRSDISRDSCEFYSGFDQGTSQGNYNAIRMEFPNLGEHCSESTCNRLDFLPLKCDACEEIFCTDHISYTSHSCPSAYKKNVQVPVCPLCNVPVPIKRGDPPDLAVGSHIDNDCQADFGKNRRKVFSNKCSSKGCKVKEMVQVKCSECGANFCLKHRHPTDHACIGAEEALRLRRLESLNKKAQTTISQSSSNSNSFRSLQGTISEDEALARALQASLQDEETSRRELQPVPSGNRDRCRLS